ncbi:UNVERIFIED_CONTAM: hypothetical protein GTU68_018150, partial [Idotea baltica]|nr:hypothetical protein [Idotea baltica]
AIAPYAGAATGAGGEIRDEGATGKGSKPKAGLAGFAVSNLEISGALNKWEEEFKSTRSKRLASPLDIMIEAPIGAANFNNEFGRPNICGYFRTFEQKVEGKSGEDYRGFHKPIMIAGGLGNIKREHVIKDNIEIGAPVYVIGGPAMLIGLGGGSASSISVGSQSEDLDFASVQRDNAEMERRCQEVIDACWSLGEENPIMAIHDVGAGGLSNALPELVNDFNRGAIFDLRKVPNSEKGMKPSELWCNESQERYVLSVSEKNKEFFENLCKRERCPFSLVGIATEEKQLIVKDTLFNNDAVNIPLEFLLGKPPRLQKNVESYTPKGDDFKASEVNLEDAIHRVLSLPTIADKSFLITIGDRSVTGLVTRDQMVGPFQVPVADVAVTSSSLSSFCGEAMAVGERPPVAILNYEAASKLAVGEAITNIMASDVKKLSDIKLSANWQVDSNLPGDDYGLYKAVEAVGMDLCPKLGICIPVGKDSMFMSTNLEDKGKVSAPISLNITAFSKVDDVTKTLTPLLVKPFEESELYLVDLGKGKNRIGGSALTQVYNKIGDITPNLDCVETFKSAFNFLNELREKNLVKAYHDRSDGGLLTTLIEMGFASKSGLNINLSALTNSEEEVNNALFSEELGFVVQVSSSDKNEFLEIAKKHNVISDTFFVGTPSNSSSVVIKNNDKTLYEADLFSLRKLWSKTSYEIQARRDNSNCAKEEFEQKLNVENSGLFFDVNFKVVKPKSFSTIPKVAILREQGTNGHTEMAYAFYKAGFEVIDVHMNDFFTGSVSLSDFKGLVACGGFSYGDVLGAGNGWATSILFNEKLKQEFSDFFNRKDTFTLGVCNGCQMLARLKSIIPNSDHFPLFVQNLSERFEARLTQVKINKSPSIFFTGMEESYLPIVLAHGEGRAQYKDQSHLKLAKNENLVSMQFVDYKKEIASTYPLNPNGSPDGITGLTSTDGRVTILMPHPERVFRNVQFSWTELDKTEESPWMQMFYNARNWVS